MTEQEQACCDAIKSQAEVLIRHAMQLGVTLEIKTIPEAPLAMGNYTMQADVRPVVIYP